MGSKVNKEESEEALFNPRSFVEKFDELTDKYELEDTQESSEFITKIWKHFNAVYPDGQMTKMEFVRDNIKFKGGNEEFWGSIFSVVDKNNSGKIDFREYLIFLMLSKSQSTKETLKLIFCLLDTDGSEFLERDEIEVFFNVLCVDYDKVLSLFQSPMKKGEKENREKKLERCIEETFLKMDENKDGLISEEEFVTFIQRNVEFKKIFVNSFDQNMVLFGQEKVQTPTTPVTTKKKRGSQASFFFKDEKEKRVNKKVNEKEFNFYEKFYNNLKDEKEKDFFFKYYGRSTKNLLEKRSLESFIVLEDIEEEFNKPSILKTRSIVGGTEKKIKVKQQNSCKCYRKSENRWMEFDFKTLNEDFISKFLFNGVNWYLNKIEVATERLNGLKKFVEKTSKEWNFDQCTLFFIYEGMEEDIHNPKDDNLYVKLCDFEEVEERTNENKKAKFNKIMLERIDQVINILDDISDEYQVII